uniref:Uncharacterized protein n=1 Tax=Trypanosoma vivax (strain Y486) TaxID=1055687 RepID=G0TVU2_TRYVY|nr:hypothetical protein, unlikely [Trypanosoma vivax Y486]
MKVREEGDGDGDSGGGAASGNGNGKYFCSSKHAHTHTKKKLCCQPDDFIASLSTCFHSPSHLLLQSHHRIICLPVYLLIEWLILALVGKQLPSLLPIPTSSYCSPILLAPLYFTP